MPTIPNSNTSTSAIGFGTSGIMGSAITERGRLKLLEHAYSLGVLHFDTAPRYGMGEAEDIVGKFIQNKRARLTVATKFGLNPMSLDRYQRLALPLARYLNRQFPQAKQFIQSRRASHGSKNDTIATEVQPQHSSLPKYSVEELQKSLHISLRKLRTDYVDVYLLHECNSANIDDAVIRKLEEFVTAGKVLSYGLATGKSEANKILNRYPTFQGCVQVAHKITDDDFESISLPNNLLTIFHSVLAQLCLDLTTYLHNNNHAMQGWSVKLDYDLSRENAIAKFLLLASKQQNANGIVLFSSSNTKNIESNLRAINGQDISANQINIFKQLISNDWCLSR